MRRQPFPPILMTSPFMGNHVDLGARGEALAASYLEDQGYDIIERNYRFKRAEVDLICYDPTAEPTGDLVFVEVKTRSGLGYGAPEDAVTESKMEQLVKVSEAYLHQNRMERSSARFDVIAIVLRQGHAPDIEHIQHAFWA